MPQKYFRTSFGHEIPIVENYRRNLPPPRDNTSAESSSSIQESLGVKGPVEDDFGITSDIYQFAILADWFRSTPLSGRRYKRMLDVGGSTGFMSMLFKAAGYVDKVENIEILDFRESLDWDRVHYFFKKIQHGRKVLRQPWSTPRDWRSRYTHWRDSVSDRNALSWQVNELDFMQSTHPFPVDKDSHYWDIDPDVPLGLDRYILGDMMELDEVYDFLLVATTMQHFSVPVFLRKAYSLLEPGGVLFIWNAYWYWALLVNRIYGDFPWAVQRLTREDWERYVAEYQPDQIENSKVSISRFHKGEWHYTVPDYIKAGEEAGFRHVAHHRLRPFSGLKNKIGAWTLEGDHGPAVQKEVLRDINEFRPDVEAVDLTTQSVFLLFQKP
jgi:hypothetical protein